MVSVTNALMDDNITPIERCAVALESIAKSLELLSQPTCVSCDPRLMAEAIKFQSALLGVQED